MLRGGVGVMVTGPAVPGLSHGTDTDGTGTWPCMTWHVQCMCRRARGIGPGREVTVWAAAMRCPWLGLEALLLVFITRVSYGAVSPTYSLQLIIVNFVNSVRSTLSFHLRLGVGIQPSCTINHESNEMMANSTSAGAATDRIGVCSVT